MKNLKIIDEEKIEKIMNKITMPFLVIGGGYMIIRSLIKIIWGI